MEKEFSVKKFSDVFGASGEAELKMLLESIDIPLRGLTVVRPVHSTVLSRSHCFQITTPSETRYFTCNSAEDANNWVAGLKEIIYPNRNKEKRVDTSLDVWIFEAKGLPSKKKYYCEIVLDKVLYGRTSTKLKSDILFWGEQFSFDDLPSVRLLSLYVFRDNEGKKKRKERSVFVGALEVPLHSIQANSEIETWLFLRPPGASPKPLPKNSINKNDQLSVRVKVKYQTVSIFPIAKYKELHEFLKQNYFILCKELESTVSLKAKDELAQTLLKILHVTNQAKEFLADIIIAEVDTLENENLTFRGNTLATKSMDTYMKMVGYKYLQKTLAQFIKSLYDMEDDIEVDPAKLTSGNLVDNQKNLLKLVEKAWSIILASHHLFPRDLQDTFNLIKKRCETLGKDVSVKLISGSVFLRFLCPAILSPSLFHLAREYPNEKTARCLTLIAKTLQNLANFTRFGGKEAYMEGLNEFVERELPNMKHFLDVISSDAERRENCGFDGYIDLGRELAVIKNLIDEQLLKLSEESKLKLSPLCSILTSLDKSKDMSCEVDTASSDNFETNLSSACSSINVTKTSEKESNENSLKVSFLDIFKNICWEDAALSSAQDYVSGCSLIIHTPSKPKGSISQRTKGRSNEGNTSLGLQAGKFSKSLNLKSFDLLRGEDTSSPGQSQFFRSSSFHGRSSRDERASILKTTKSFDTEKLIGENSGKPGVRNRYWLNAAKSDSRLRSKSDQISRVPDDAPTKMKISSSLNSDINIAAASAYDISGLSNSNGDKEKTIRRIPDIIHQSVMWNEASDQPVQPLYFSPATEPMTPLGKRQFKFGLESLNQLQTTYNSELRNQSNGSSGYFSSLKSITDEQKTDNFQKAYTSFSGKSSEIDFVAPFCNPDKSRDVGKSNSLPTKSRNLDDLGVLHCSSLTGKSSSLDQIESKFVLHNKHDDSMDEDISFQQPSQPIPSLGLLIDSNERGASHKCNKSGNKNNTVHSYLEHQQSSNNSNNEPIFYGEVQGQPDVSSIENSIERMESTDNLLGGDRESSAAEQDGGETRELRRLLRETQLQLQAKDVEFAKSTKMYEHSIVTGKKKLEEVEKKLQNQKRDKEEQMKSIIHRLTNVESELRREQREMQEIVQAKQKIIEVQEKRIKSLDSANRRLVSALNQLRAKCTTSNTS